MIVKTEIVEQEKFYVSGISVRTINNGKAGEDIKNLWHRFQNENVYGQLENKVSYDIYCVYTDYETDHTGYYTAILGCNVNSLVSVPDGFKGITLPAGKYRVYHLAGKCPQNVPDAWQQIWDSGVERKYTADFDVYKPDIKNFEDSEVKIFLGVKQPEILKF